MGRERVLWFPILFAFDLYMIEPRAGAHSQVTVLLPKVTSGIEALQMPLLGPMPN